MYTATATSFSTYYSCDTPYSYYTTVSTGLSNISSYGASYGGTMWMTYTSWTVSPACYYASVSNFAPAFYLSGGTSDTATQMFMQIHNLGNGKLGIEIVGYRGGTTYARQTYAVTFHFTDGNIVWWAEGN